MTDLTKISGFVKAVTSKYSGGVNIDDVWYNGTDRTKQYIEKVHKGDKAELDVDLDGKIHFIKILEAAPAAPAGRTETFGQQGRIELSAEEKAVIIDHTIGVGKNIMMAVKKVAEEEIFKTPEDKERYKDSIGQHINSMFIFVTRQLEDKGVL
jgi:hypothetical protein